MKSFSLLKTPCKYHVISSLPSPSLIMSINPSFYYTTPLTTKFMLYNYIANNLKSDLSDFCLMKANKQLGSYLQHTLPLTDYWEYQQETKCTEDSQKFMVLGLTSGQSGSFNSSLHYSITTTEVQPQLYVPSHVNSTPQKEPPNLLFMLN